MLVTSYQLVISDEKFFKRVQWQFMILDEAQVAARSVFSIFFSLPGAQQCANISDNKAINQHRRRLPTAGHQVVLVAALEDAAGMLVPQPPAADRHARAGEPFGLRSSFLSFFAEWAPPSQSDSHPLRPRRPLLTLLSQNSMAELWALLHFVMPQLFDSLEQFSQWFSRGIEARRVEEPGVSAFHA